MEITTIYEKYAHDLMEGSLEAIIDGARKFTKVGRANRLLSATTADDNDDQLVRRMPIVDRPIIDSDGESK